jgi:signal transduction histidine kinase
MAGAHGALHAPLVALLSYLLVGTLLLVPQPGSIWAMGLAGAVVTVSEFVAQPTPEVHAGAAAIIWAQASLLILATGLVLMAGISAVRRANHLQSEALTAEQKASEIKSDFVSLVTHELRTPLTNITGFTSTLSEMWRDLDPDEVDEFLAIIDAEAGRLGDLVEDVLVIPKLEAGRLLVDVTEFPLRPLAFKVADRIVPAGGDKSASVSVDGHVVVRADPNRLEQILRHLLDNATKYGGDSIGITAAQDPDGLVITVSDNGPGIPEADRDRVFEPFEQGSRGDDRTNPGAGLGLAVTRKLVEAMGGRIWYEAGFPVGARLCFTLPAGEPVAPAEQSSAPGGSAGYPA